MGGGATTPNQITPETLSLIDLLATVHTLQH
jgi:hypothetical protein